MKAIGQILIGVVGGLAGAGLLFLLASRPRGEPVPLRPPPTPAPITVHVTGAVIQQGVYRLPAASRVQDAIEAAGGFGTQAAQDAVNLASPLQDGAQVWVPALPAAGGAEGGSQQTVLQPPAARVDLNTATQAELESLPGIGPATAAKILAYREEHGPFVAIEEIQNVSGIGPATFERLRDLITVRGAP
jgi:competence protein ComEA